MVGRNVEALAEAQRERAAQAIAMGEGGARFSRGAVGTLTVMDGGRIVSANPQAAHLLGLDPAQSLPTLSDLMAEPIDADALLAVFAQARLGGRVTPSRTLKARTADGHDSTVEFGLVDSFKHRGHRRFVFSVVDAKTTDLASGDDRAASLKTIYDNIAEGIYRCDMSGQLISANPALVRLHGFDTEADMLLALRERSQNWYIDAGRREVFRALLDDLGEVRDFISQVRRVGDASGDDKPIWISENARVVRDETGEPLFYEGTVRDVTQSLQLAREGERLAKIAGQAPGLLFQSTIDADGKNRMAFASAGIRDLLGLDPEQVEADIKIFERRVHPDDRQALLRAIVGSSKSMKPWASEFRMRRADGTEIWVGGRAAPERTKDGQIIWHGFLSDVTEMREARDRIHKLAYYDALTGLPNRTMLRERAEHELASSGRHGAHGAFVFIDLDNFKLLNDTRGHHIGDELLKQVGQRLVGIVRRSDMVARLGGDEFVVLLTLLGQDVDDAAGRADLVAEKLRAEINRPYVLDGQTFHTSPSLGVALYKGLEHDVDEILKQADTAMYRAKAAGRNVVRRFIPRMAAEVSAEASSLDRVRQALTSDATELHVQPLVMASGRVAGGEALLRWDDEERGPVAPLDLLADAAQIGMAARLNRSILAKACAYLAGWQKEGLLDKLSISVNVTAEQIQNETFELELLNELDRAGASPEQMILEVTEHAMMGDIDTVADTMKRLRDQGLRFALDDFGTGYASLTHLRRLPLDEIKIDRSFVQGLLTDKADAEIVRAIIAVAGHLHLTVTAEGVETAEQAAQLVDMGCDKLQGFHFGRPMTEDAFRLAVTEMRLREGADRRGKAKAAAPKRSGPVLVSSKRVV